MDVHFIEYAPKKSKDKNTGEVIEEEEKISVRFETHPAELGRSVAERYAEHKVKYYGAPKPPPGTLFFLREGVRGTYLNQNLTMKDFKKEGIVSFELGVRI